MSNILDQLFPAAPPHRHEYRHKLGNGFEERREDVDTSGSKYRQNVSTRWASIYTLELRGLSHKQIAEALKLAPQSIGRIISDPRYIEYRERHLSALDQEFVAMKPLAFAALKGGLTSQDENTALRASEQWFKGANYGGFSKHERPATTATAEDIARQLLTGIQVNVQVNTASAGEARAGRAVIDSCPAVIETSADTESEEHGGDA